MTKILFLHTLLLNVNKVTGETALGGAAFALYKKYVTVPEGKQAATSITYDNGKKTYSIPTGENWVLVAQKTADANTKTFAFDRVDDGEYLLVETTTPDGYNSVQPMQFKVEAVHVAEAEDPTLTSVTGTDTHGTATTLDAISLGEFTVSGKLSGVSTNVNNESGSVLPSTGGMGTTIFYVIGAILVLGAGILLVSKRRMSAN